ncbi:MAG: alpha/beta hydrolase [archaeon]|nr:alpha/beta hydrolase [archaeon]
MELLGFAHNFVQGKKESKNQTILLLHGTGGNENDLIPLGHEIAPDSSLLGVRGKVLENGMPRYFRRFGEGVFDIEDLKFRTKELANFVKEASKHYRFDLDLTVAIGYSNGANIAASLLVMRPEILRGAILFRAMLPFSPEKLPRLSGKLIFLSAGKFDSLTSPSQVEDLKDLLEKYGAHVSLNWESSDHSLTQEEAKKAKKFFQVHFA